jgi:hypothetical protein
MRKFSTGPSALAPQSCFLKVADIIIALISNTSNLRLHVEGAKKDFLINEVDPDVTLRAAWKDLSKETWGRKLFDSNALWQLYDNHGSYTFRFTSVAFGPVPYKSASFSRNFTTGEVYLHPPFFDPDKPVDPTEYPLDELLITNLLAQGRGVEIHACGVIAPSGDGYLFVGQSGAGKTTMARILQKANVRILSDDRIILRQIDNRFWIYGTPWHGEAELACPDRSPLREIFFLRHGATNELENQKGTEAIANLFASSFVPFYNGAGLDFTLGFFERLTQAVPCHELKFVPDESIINYLKWSGHES